LVKKVTSLVTDSYGDLERAIILELAERLPEGIDATPLAAALLNSRLSGLSLPVPALFAALAPHLYAGTRSDALAAAELAWRQNPTAPGLRSIVLAAARRSTLSRIDPRFANGETTATPARWLTVNDSSANSGGAAANNQPLAPDRIDSGARTGSAAAISELELGRDTRIEVGRHPDEPDRLGVVRIYVATPADSPGPVRVTFDGEVHSLVALRLLDVVEFAASAGSHTLKVDAPTTARAFAAFPGQSQVPPTFNRAPAVTIRKRWPVDRTIEYALPTPHVAGPVRIELFGSAGKHAGRHSVWLHPEIGAPRRFVLDVRGADSRSWPLDDDADSGASAAIWVWLPTATTTFWLTTDGEPLYAHISVHGAAAESAVSVRATAAPPLPGSVGPVPGRSESDGLMPRDPSPIASLLGLALPLVARDLAPRAQRGSSPSTHHLHYDEVLNGIAELSAAIAEHPQRAQLYIARAVALLEQGEIGPARRDLAAAAPLVSDRDRSEYRDALRLFEAAAEPSYLPVQPVGGLIQSGVPIGRPLIPPIPELVAIVRRVRQEGAVAIWDAMERKQIALPQGPASVPLVAAIAAQAGQARAAADRWLRVGTWQAQAAALVQLGALIEAGTADVAPLAFGIAGELDAVVTPALQRARAVAARASRWEPLRHTLRSGGFESLSTVPDGLDEPPAIELRRALLATPWRAASAILAPGQVTTLATDGPRTVRVEAWCRRLWPAARPPTCSLTSALDQTPARSVTVQHARVHPIIVEVPAGHHELEVGLAADDPTALAGVRFVDPQAVQADSSIAAVQPMLVFLAAADRPAEVAVPGPGAMGVELRGYDGRGGAADVAIIGPSGERHIRIDIDATAAPETRSEPNRDIRVTRPVTRTIVLDQSGPHTIRVTPERDVVAVRFATRVSMSPTADTPFIQTSDIPDGLPWPVAMPQPVLGGGVEPAPRWIPSIEAVIGQDSFAALDSEFAALDLRFELAAQLRRRERDQAWIAELRGRRSGLLGPTGRIRVAGEFRRLPLGLNAGIDLHAAVQTSPVGMLWLARAIGNVSRPWMFSPRLQLVPGVAAYGAVFGPDQVPLGADPMVASVYRRDHPLQLAESLELSGRPFADQYATIGFNIRSNDSPASVDMIGGKLMWRGLIETSPHRGGILMLEYAPTFRLANNHRSYAFVRHDLAAEILWPWAIAGGRLGRVVVSLRGDLYPPTNISQTAHALALSVRWDGWHPGERNRMPSEEALSDYVDEVPWAGQRSTSAK